MRLSMIWFVFLALGWFPVCWTSICSPGVTDDCPLVMSSFIQPVLDGFHDPTNTDDYHISCKSEYIKPGVSVEWYLDGTKQTDYSGQDTFVYQAKTYETHNVQCRLEKDSKHSKPSPNCTIPGKGSFSTPVIQVWDSPQVFLLGGSYSLQCSCLKHPDAIYTWKKDGVVLDSSVQHVYRMTWTHIENNRTGNYTCTATLHGESKESDPYEVVVVEDPPTPVVEIVTGPPTEENGQWMHVKAGSTYDLFCSNPAHVEECFYEWYRGKESLGLFRGNSLRLYNIGIRDNGIYSCKFNFGWKITMIWKSKASDPLAIYTGRIAPPEPDVANGVESFITGSNYVLVCYTGVSFKWAYGMAKYAWKRDDNDLGTTSTDGSIRLENIGVKDEGKYTCSVILGNVTIDSTDHFTVEGVTNNGRYCDSLHPCNGTLFVEGLCQGLMCSCISGYRIEGKGCAPSPGLRIAYTWTLVFGLAFVAVCNTVDIVSKERGMFYR